tara:strand:- start:2904 stop:3254 length:351 start_codon:yes stop_codon:yes gene_type:complete
MSDDSLNTEKIIKQTGYIKKDLQQYISYDMSEKITNDLSKEEIKQDEINKIYNKLATCKCCKRHTSGRPIKCCKGAKNTESLELGGPNKINMCFAGIICDCHCRQLMRMIVYNIND